MSTDQLSPAAVPAPVPAQSWRPPAARSTGLATASLVLGIVAVVLNVLLVPTVLAIVFGALAIGRGTAARTRAVVGIVLGGLGVVTLFLQIAILIPVVIALTGGAHHVPFHLRMAASIERDLNDGGMMVVSDVRCPVAGELFVGKRITCTADRAGTGPIRIDVTFTDAYGAYTWVTDSTPTG